MSSHFYPRSFSISTLIAFVAGTVAGAFLVSRRQQSRRPRRHDCTAEEHLWQIVAHSFTAALLNVGDKLRIYDVLWKKGPMTAQQLAASSSSSSHNRWSERFVKEFLCQMTAAGICRYSEHNQTFSLPVEYAELLCSQRDDETVFSKLSIAGMFPYLLALLKRSEAVVVRGIETGIGVDYDWTNDIDGDNTRSSNNNNNSEGIIQREMDRKNRPWYEAHLLKEIIETILVPSYEKSKRSLVDLLEQGVNAAYVGCGSGASTLVLARRFPKSHFYAFESSQKAIEILNERIRTEKVTNVTVCNANEWTVGDGPHPGQDNKSNMFSFVYSHDVLHDMTHPRELIRDVRKRLEPDGCWVIVDVECYECLSRNLQRPDAEQLYGFSCLLCLPCSTTTPDGEGLGTLGLTASLLYKWTSEAGFAQFEQHTIPSAPLNTCFVVA